VSEVAAARVANTRGHARARSLIVGLPSCSVQPNGQVICYAGDPIMVGAGAGTSETPVPVSLR